MTNIPSASGLNLPDWGKEPLGPSSLDPAADAKVERFRNVIRPAFETWVFRRIERLLEFDPLAAFILMSCAVDYLAGYWRGRETEGADYIEFIKAYFPKKPDGSHIYNAEGLYRSLRCGLVHMMTIKGGTYTLTDKKPELHRQESRSGQTNLNAENFYRDLSEAKEKFFDLVPKNPDLLQNVFQRDKDFGFMDIVEFVR